MMVMNNEHVFFVIAEFMLEHLEIEEDNVPRMCLELYREHGTTMAGLKVKRNTNIIFI